MATCEVSLPDGFWSPNKHYGYPNTFKYDREKVVLEKNTIVEPERTRTVYNWLQHFSLEHQARLTFGADGTGMKESDLYFPREFSSIAVSLSSFSEQGWIRACQGSGRGGWRPLPATFDNRSRTHSSAQRRKILLKSEKPSTSAPAHVCNCCGSCCRNFAYIRLSQDDVKTLETFTGLVSEEFSGNVDKAGESRFMKFQENGDCIFLTMLDGAYSCSVYEARSVTCRGYPSTDVQIETCHANSDR